MKPDAQRRGGLLEDRSGQRKDVIPAMVTGVSCASSNPVMLALNIAALLLSQVVIPSRPPGVRRCDSGTHHHGELRIEVRHRVFCGPGIELFL